MQLSNWQQQNAITLIASDGDEETEYRVTFKTMTAYDEAVFNRKRAKAFGILEDVFGPADDRDEETVENAIALLDIMVKHAAIMASLGSVERKNGKGWIPDRLPEIWYDAKEFAYHAPHSVLNHLFEAAIDAGNPMQVFSFAPLGEAEKKTLRIHVHPSEN